MSCERKKEKFISSYPNRFLLDSGNLIPMIGMPKFSHMCALPLVIHNSFLPHTSAQAV